MRRRAAGTIAVLFLMLAPGVTDYALAQAKKNTGRDRVEPTIVHVEGPTIIGYVPPQVADAEDLDGYEDVDDDSDPRSARWDFSKAIATAERCLKSAGKGVRVEFVVGSVLVIEQKDKVSKIPLPKVWPRSIGAYLVDVDRTPCLVTSRIGAHGLIHDGATAAGEYFGVPSCVDEISVGGFCKGPDPAAQGVSAPSVPSTLPALPPDGGANNSAARAASSAPAARDASPQQSVAACATGEECRDKGEDLFYGRIGCQNFQKPQDTEAAFPYFVAGCDKGDASSCMEMGSALWERGASARAAAAHQRACDLGHLPSCIWTVTEYEYGSKDKGRVDKDPKKAAALARRLCTAGLNTGCVNAADFYRKGFGVDKDAKRAAALDRRARLLGPWDFRLPNGGIPLPCNK
jgi:TPR repeat protein